MKKTFIDLYKELAERKSQVKEMINHFEENAKKPEPKLDN